MSSELFNTVWEVPQNMRASIQSQFYLSSSAIDDPSPWTGERTPYGPFAQIHIAEITPPSAPSAAKAREGQATWRDWQGFMTRLRGTSGLLRIVDYHRMRPRYDELHGKTLSNWSDGLQWSDGSQWETGALPPFVTFDENAVVDSDNIVMRGLPPNIAEVLSPADLFEVRPNGVPTGWGNLYEVIHCSRSNADGKARVYFQPGLRQGFAAGDMIVLRYPTSVFRLADKGQGIVTRSLGNVGNVGFKLIEEMRNV